MKYILFFIFISCSTVKEPEDKSIWSKYEAVMIEHPPIEKVYDCKEADFQLNRQALQYKKIIKKDIAGVNRPNFAGMYRLIEIQKTKDSIWFIRDCKTGKILESTLDGHLMFSLESLVVIQNPPKMSETEGTYKVSSVGFPEIYLFDVKSSKFQLIPNSIQPLQK